MFYLDFLLLGFPQNSGAQNRVHHYKTNLLISREIVMVNQKYHTNQVLGITNILKNYPDRQNKSCLKVV